MQDEYIGIYIHTHTHTHIHVNSHREKVRVRVRVRVRVMGSSPVCTFVVVLSVREEIIIIITMMI